MAEQNMIFWVNPNRPDMQYRTNGVSSWKRKIGEETWRYHECPAPKWPSEFRYQVDEKQLEDRKN